MSNKEQESDLLPRSSDVSIIPNSPDELLVDLIRSNEILALMFKAQEESGFIPYARKFGLGESKSAFAFDGFSLWSNKFSDFMKHHQNPDDITKYVHPDDLEKLKILSAEAYQKRLQKKGNLSPNPIRVRFHDGVCYEFTESATLLEDDCNTILIFGSMKDVTDDVLRKEAEELLREEIRKKSEENQYLATHDQLTGLLNRRALVDYMASHEFSHELSNSLFIICDINKFKRINDTYGHPVGDKVLQEVAHAMQHAVKDTDRVFRLGGDEFAAIIGEITPNAAEEILRRLALQCSKEYVISQQQGGDLTIEVTLSVGAHCIGEDDHLLFDQIDQKKEDDQGTREEFFRVGILSKADEYQYSAKERSRDDGKTHIVLDGDPVSTTPHTSS